jgi:hypothetical protein
MGIHRFHVDMASGPSQTEVQGGIVSGSWIAALSDALYAARAI